MGHMMGENSLLNKVIIKEKSTRKYYGGTEGANIYYFNILKPFVNRKFGEWKFDMEGMVGTFLFDNGHTFIYATPYWEGVDGVAIYATDDEGTDIFQMDQALPMITGDSKKDSDAYFKLMMQITKRVK